MVKPQTSDIQVTYEYIRVTYGWHTSTYEWLKDDIRVHMSKIRMHTITYEWHRDDIPVHTNDIRMTYGWHAVRLWKKNKVIFFKTFWYFSSKISDFVKEFLACNGCFELLAKSKRGLKLAFSAHFPYGFFIQMPLIQYFFNWESFNVISFLQGIKRVIKFLFRQFNWWRHNF